VVRAAGIGSPAPTSSFASLERTLERTVDTLMKGETSSESKALLIEARRLRSVVANWRSIPPPSDVYDEMLDRVLHLSTAAGASLYEPSPESLRAEFDPVLRTDYEPGLYDDFERTERTEIEPVPFSARGHASPRLDPNFDDGDGPTIRESPRFRSAPPPPVEISRYPVASVPNRRAPDPDPVIAVDAGEARYPPDPVARYDLDYEPPRPARPLAASSTGTRPAEPLRTNTGMSPRGRALGTRSGMPAHAAPRASDMDDPPSYPAFDSPAEYAADDDAPSYPAYELEPTRPVPAPSEVARARYSAPPPAPVASSYPTHARAPSHPPPRMQSSHPPRTPSYPPAAASSHPPPTRSGFPPPITGDHLRSQAPPEMVIDGGGAPDEAAIAPTTSVNVTVVQLGEKIDPHIVLLSDAYSDRADAYRALRRKLASSGNPQVIAITSPDVGEGKTTCALNLALAMRETSRGKVLLIEANGRSPSIARLLGFTPPECFCDQLTQRKEDPRRPWVAVEAMPKLHIMAVDPTTKRPPQLDPIAFSNGMERLKQAGYEYILIDTPPVLGTFEANMIADNVDGVLFTAITMKSKRSHLRKAMEQIMPAPVLGVMVLDS
jgi:Mrp family chromosome partitioning ATPase